MQYSDTTNKNGIIQREEALCNIGDGGISGDTTLLKQFTGYNNSAYHEIWMAIMSVDKNNKADDYNYTNYPDAPITMVLNQQDYTIPVAVTGGNVASFLRLGGVYFLYNNERTYLTQMTADDVLSSTSGEPTKYKLNGQSIFFNCPLNQATLTKYGSLFYVEFQRVPDAFLYTDTTQQPGFLETYHDLIPLKASAMYLLPKDLNLSTAYEQRFLTRLEFLKRDIANLDDNSPKQITGAYQNNE